LGLEEIFMKLLMENWRNFISESHSKEDEEELKKISDELEGAVKMHQNQADRIDKILDSTDDEDLEEGKKKNCGCGQDPCVTYGIQEVKAGDKDDDEYQNKVRGSFNDALEEEKNEDGKEKGADGKACWDGYKHTGTEDGKDKCVPMEEGEYEPGRAVADIDTGEEYLSPEDINQEEIRDLADKFNVEAFVETASDGKTAILVFHQDGQPSAYNDTEEMYQDLASRQDMNDVPEAALDEKVDKDSMPCNKPRRTSSHKGKSHVVKACENGKEKIIPFGEKGASTAGKPKKGESDKMKAKRKSFKARHAKNIKKGKMSAAYWADKEKW